MSVRRLSSQENHFDQKLSDLLSWQALSDETVQTTVRDILDDVRCHGDRAVLRYTAKYDRIKAASVAELELDKTVLNAALAAIAPDQRNALMSAAERIRCYAEHQKLESWSYTENNGTVLGQRVTPIDRAGLYVPGGKASYPSSVLMNAIPAKVAGVSELVMVVPTPAGVRNDMVLAAAAVAGVDRVFTVGGAQAIAAMAYGTETLPKVDKITGPGNIYVATAKRQVFGVVGIDMFAGPSEIVVICDGKTDPDWIAMDLFSQAEHDEDAQAILISPDSDFLDRVQDSVEKLLPTLQRRQIVDVSLAKRGALIQVQTLVEAIDLVNEIAPEHLELSFDQAADYVPHIRHAGAIFMGRYTAEALGDYCAGPNHVLPTSRAARFASPLGVYDFQKRSSLIQVSPAGAVDLGKIASVLASAEGLQAHARSAEYRIHGEVDSE